MTVWAFWNQSFLMKSNNSFPQWAYLILPNPTSVEAYFCPHTKPNKDKFLILCSDLCIETFDKSENRSMLVSPFFFFFFLLSWPQNCPSTITACRDSVNKTWIKQLICIKYWEKSIYFKNTDTKHLQTPMLLLFVCTCTESIQVLRWASALAQGRAPLCIFMFLGNKIHIHIVVDLPRLSNLHSTVGEPRLCTVNMEKPLAINVCL